VCPCTKDFYTLRCFCQSVDIRGYHGPSKRPANGGDQGEYVTSLTATFKQSGTHSTPELSARWRWFFPICSCGDEPRPRADGRRGFHSFRLRFEQPPVSNQLIGAQARFVGMGPRRDHDFVRVRALDECRKVLLYRVRITNEVRG
jgi:hypothetical protein